MGQSPDFQKAMDYLQKLYATDCADDEDLFKYLPMCTATQLFILHELIYFTFIFIISIFYFLIFLYFTFILHELSTSATQWETCWIFYKIAPNSLNPWTHCSDPFIFLINWRTSFQSSLHKIWARIEQNFSRGSPSPPLQQWRAEFLAWAEGVQWVWIQAVSFHNSHVRSP